MYHSFVPEFKGLREFNKKGLQAILLELALNLDYTDEDSVETSRLLIKPLIDHSPNYYAGFSIAELEDAARYRKPVDMTWRDFDTYSRDNFNDYELTIQ